MLARITSYTAICLLCLTILTRSEAAPSRENAPLQTDFAAQSICLQDAFANYKQETAKEKKSAEVKKYYDCFPRTFEGFKSIFGYREVGGSTEYSPLYGGEPGNLIEILPDVEKVVGTKKYIRLLIQVSIGGNWQADGVNILQHLALKALEDDPSLFLSILVEHSDSEIRSFWGFVLDSYGGFNPAKYSCPDVDKDLSACRLLLEIKKSKAK